jgi:hypothetical protein
LPILKFFNYQTQEWKDKHIACWISASGTFGGAATRTRPMVSGDNSGYVAINATMYRDALQTFQSSLILMPTPTIYGNDSAIVVIGNNSYTAFQIDQMLLDLGLTTEAASYSNFLQEKLNLTAPGVPLHCFHGIGTPTAAQYVYANGTDQEPQVALKTDGDGTINTISLDYCQYFQSNNPANFVQVAMNFTGASHRGVLLNQVFLQQTLSILVNSSGGTSTSSPAPTASTNQFAHSVRLTTGYIVLIVIGGTVFLVGILIILRTRFNKSKAHGFKETLIERERENVTKITKQLP